MAIEKPYLLFLGDVRDALAAKTAYGVVDWRRDWCVGQMRLPGCKADTGLPDMTFAEARAAGAKTFVVGAVNAGGVLPEHWIATIVEAIDRAWTWRAACTTGSARFRRSARRRKGTARSSTTCGMPTARFATGKGTRRRASAS